MNRNVNDFRESNENDMNNRYVSDVYLGDTGNNRGLIGHYLQDEEGLEQTNFRDSS